MCLDCDKHRQKDQTSDERGNRKAKDRKGARLAEKLKTGALEPGEVSRTLTQMAEGSRNIGRMTT